MTGDRIYKNLQIKADLDYTAYFGSVKANELFKEAMLNACGRVYANRLSDQNAFDEINFLIATDEVFSLNNNRIYIHDLLITGVTVLATTWTITTELAHNLVIGDTITTTGIAGFSVNPNGTYTVATTPTTTTLTITTTTATGA